MSINEPSEVVRPDTVIPMSRPIPQLTELQALMSMIERVSRDPSVDVDKLMKLKQMYDEAIARQAKMVQVEAFVRLQIKLPIIPEHGEIKNKEGRVQSTYPLWEDTNELIKPVLSEHGFALSFLISTPAPGIVVVTAILDHVGGHSTQTSVPLPYDTSGSKNSVQSVGSSLSYGHRYTAKALLNLTSRGEDDDGFKGGSDPKLNAEQIEKLKVRIKEVGANEDVFLTYLAGRLDRAIARLEDLPATAYGEALDALNAKERQMKKRGSNV